MASTIMNTSLDQSIEFEARGHVYHITPFREDDIPALHKILAQEVVSDRLLLVPKPYTLEMAAEWITSRTASNSALLSIPTVEERKPALFSQAHGMPLEAIRSPLGQYIGCVSLTPPGDVDIVELGYYLDPDYHGKGIMAPAAKAVLRWAKEEFGVEKVFATADRMNPQSAAVIDRVSRETSIADVQKGEKILTWPVEKKVAGREVNSVSTIWTWRI